MQKHAEKWNFLNGYFEFPCLLISIFLFFFLVFIIQGSSETPQFTSRRCIIMLILLFGFLIFQFYSASIVGSLLMEKSKTIKTLRNLIDSPLKLGIEDIVYNKDFFKVSKIYCLLSFELVELSRKHIFSYEMKMKMKMKQIEEFFSFYSLLFSCVFKMSFKQQNRFCQRKCHKLFVMKSYLHLVSCYHFRKI